MLNAWPSNIKELIVGSSGSNHSIDCNKRSELHSFDKQLSAVGTRIIINNRNVDCLSMADVGTPSIPHIVARAAWQAFLIVRYRGTWRKLIIKWLDMWLGGHAHAIISSINNCCLAVTSASQPFIHSIMIRCTWKLLALWSPTIEMAY